MNPNAYLDLADRQISAPRQTRLRAAEIRAEKREAEREEQIAQWRRQRREQQAKILRDGPYTETARQLTELLDTLTPDGTDALIECVRRGQWRNADQDTRQEVLSLVDSALIEMRESYGQPSFNDPLPSESDDVFLILRRWLA